jgi:hypothetical protein
MSFQFKCERASRQNLKVKSLPALLFITCLTANCSEIQIRVLLGKDGQPQVGRSIFLWQQNANGQPIPVGGGSPTTYKLLTDSKGIVRINIPDENSFAFYIGGQQECYVHRQSTAAKQTFKVKEVLSSGVVTLNDCGKASSIRTPGELTVFVRKSHWWEFASD